MTTETFNAIIEAQIDRSTDVLCAKAAEYATADRLHNFRVAAALRGCSELEALAGMMAKHTVSVYDMCRDGKSHELALWREKITDSINYLLLLAAMVEGQADGAQEPETLEVPQRGNRETGCMEERKKI